MRQECAVKVGERKGMQEPDTEDLASHSNPESWAEVGNDQVKRGQGELS